MRTTHLPHGLGSMSLCQPFLDRNASFLLKKRIHHFPPHKNQTLKILWSTWMLFRINCTSYLLFKLPLVLKCKWMSNIPALNELPNVNILQRQKKKKLWNRKHGSYSLRLPTLVIITATLQGGRSPRQPQPHSFAFYGICLLAQCLKYYKYLTQVC